MRSTTAVAVAAVLLSSTAITAVPLASTVHAADPGDVVITEIMQNPAAVADSAGEWFEITNVTDSPVDLGGWTISDNDLDSHVIAGSVVIPACGVAVIGNNLDGGTNGGVTVDYSYGGSLFLANGADEVVLTDSGGVEFDRVEYDGGPLFPDPTGASMSLVAGATDNNVGSNWETATAPYGAGDLGTPGSSPFQCDPGGSPELVVSEIMFNPASAEDDWEWIEIANTGRAAADLTGWVVDDINSVALAASNIASASVPPGGSVVLYNSDDVSAAEFAEAWGTDLTLVAVTNWSTLGLNNGGDQIGLWDDFATYAGDHQVHANAVVSVAYDGSIDDGSASIYLTDLAADANDFGNWALSQVGGATPVNAGYQSLALGGNSGGDVGSPSATPPEVVLAIGECGDPATFLHEVQGSGASSPLSGETVVVEAVVVGDFQDSVGSDGDLNGFHVQEEDADADADATTSEGLFVFQGSRPLVDVAQGDLVRVIGVVSEFNGLTEISSTEVLVCAPVPLPTPATVHLPVDSLDEFEHVEGMSVASDQELSISEYFNFDRFGEVVLTAGRLFQPTAVFAPGSTEAADLADLNGRSRITLDDGRTSQNPDPARHPNGQPFTLDNRFRGGDVLTGVVGVMDYSFGLYRIQPTAGATHTVTNPRPDVPNVGGDLRVASFNVLNYFSTVDDGVNDICGPARNQECRGADDEGERVRQLDKIVAAMAALDADVLGIIEVENTTGVEAMADIVDALNADVGAGTYDYVDTGTIGDDAIKVGFIYRPGSVTPIGDHAVLDSPAFVAPFGEPRNRPALAQTFAENLTGSLFTPVVNHLKSKGSGCGAGDDDPEAGSCNLTRTVSAQVLTEWLATDPTGSGDGDVLILGDLNAYDQEDPIAALAAAGYTDLEALFGGEFAYSYVFDGQLGYLDYALANAGLLSQVTGAAAWHINADEPDLLDYDTSFKQAPQDAIYAPDPFRASDHDPVLAGLHLDTDVATVIGLTIDRVEALEADGALNGGQANALVRRLDQALRQYERGRTSSTVDILTGIVDQLEDFVADGVLTTGEAAPLADAIVRLLDDIA